MRAIHSIFTWEAPLAPVVRGLPDITVVEEDVDRMEHIMVAQEVVALRMFVKEAPRLQIELLQQEVGEAE